MSGEVDPGELAELLRRVPAGWTRQSVAGIPWGVSRTEHAHGRSIALHAEQLGGSDIVSANVWLTAGGALLRPCEMPAEKVLGFLRALPEADGGPVAEPGFPARADRRD